MLGTCGSTFAVLLSCGRSRPTIVQPRASHGIVPESRSRSSRPEDPGNRVLLPSATLHCLVPFAREVRRVGKRLERESKLGQATTLLASLSSQCAGGVRSYRHSVSATFCT